MSTNTPRRCLRGVKLCPQLNTNLGRPTGWNEWPELRCTPVIKPATSDGSKAWWATEVMAARNILLLIRFQQRLSSLLSTGLSLHASIFQYYITGSYHLHAQVAQPLMKFYLLDTARTNVVATSTNGILSYGNQTRAIWPTAAVTDPTIAEHDLYLMRQCRTAFIIRGMGKYWSLKRERKGVLGAVDARHCCTADTQH
jgi:hypothetical protein